jgi:hypothetical protein
MYIMGKATYKGMIFATEVYGENTTLCNDEKSLGVTSKTQKTRIKIGLLIQFR